MTVAEQPTRPQIGDVRMHYTMYPLDARGNSTNGGNDYADADSIEAARKWAHRVLGLDDPTLPRGHLGGVAIHGQMMRLGCEAWAPLKGAERQASYEVIRHPNPTELVRADLAMRCYETTVRDYLEFVHERRSNGTCRCGYYGRWEWPA